ncbi:MAG: sugar phosphate isomerase/epimerase family protein [Longimicrobiales bacterium]
MEDRRRWTTREGFFVKAVRPRVGVCSWSLRPDSARDLAGKLQDTGLSGVQLALDPLRTGAMPAEDVTAAFEPRGIHILSGMMAMDGEDYSTLESIRSTGGIVPDETWEANLGAAAENAKLARELGLTLVTFHAGFVPHEAGAERSKLIGRLGDLADAFGEQGVDVALETGQESATTLGQLLEELNDRRIGVNFDPANMILYGMGDPIAAVRALSPYIRQVHIKDAIATTVPGTWGSEVPAGTGDVPWPDFFRTLHQCDVRCDFLIEREAGESRVDDVRIAGELVERFAGT